MSLSASTVRTLIDYTANSSRKLVEVAALLTPDELVHDFKFSERHLLGTLAHIFAADRVWYGRITDNVPARFIDPDSDVRLSVLQEDWPKLHDRWKEWAATLTDEAVEAKLTYRDLKGNVHEEPIWQIVTHVVNHGTHHRGQVSGMLRAMGHAPPVLDLIAYYRSCNQVLAAGSK
ncbi:MAG TPA: DinB family protein [Bryobacteraceae bacterium]|nr:DinB family protein [Bryobacteraceae bacterium]